jgi:thioredoxin 1
MLAACGTVTGRASPGALLAGPGGTKRTTKGPMMAHPTDTTDATFESDVLQSDLPVLVDFWAPWCGPCRMVAPVVEELSNDYDGKVKFVKLNTDDNPAVAAKFGIRSIPTLLIFKNGEVAGQVVGFRPKSDLAKHLDAALA